MGRQRGFTLTELLVALALGSLLVIGAGQLLLSSFRTFDQVDRLGRQQEALVYTATTLASRLRRQGAFDDQGEALFHLSCNGYPGECRCTVQDMAVAQPLVSFDKRGEGACFRDEPLGETSREGTLRVSLPLGPKGREVAFHVTPRQDALHPDDPMQ
ncbi:PilW family protein [Vreelandella sp. EE22]